MKKDKTDSVEMLWMDRLNYSEGWSIKTHSHNNFFQMYLINTGSFLCIYNDEITELDENSFLLIPPNTSHGIPEIQKGEIKILDIKFSINDSFIKKEITALGGRGDISDLPIKERMEEIREYGKETPFLYKKIADCILEYILLLLIKEKSSIDKSIGIEEKNKSYDSAFSGKSSDLVNGISEYIKEKYMSNISLDELQDVFGYSKNYICQKFKAEKTIAIKQYINTLKIEKAKELIALNKEDLKSIADTLGFCNIHYFNRVFKEYTGCSPAFFREKELKEYRKPVIFNYDYTIMCFDYFYGELREYRE